MQPDRLEYIRKQAKCELARRSFWDYCKVQAPEFYLDDRTYLRDICEQIQAFTEQDIERILILNMPPRHGKSRTGTNLAPWLFGENPLLKIMTGSYNETLSTTFAKQVRDTIQEQSAGGRIVYGDIFPNTKVKYGEASMSLWSLEGSKQKSYLATSPTGTATGFGADYLILDDIIKSDKEAFNQTILDGHWDWFVNTMMQRLEAGGKVIVIMTRWATNDLAGRILAKYGALVRHINYKAVQDDGTMLCDDILNRADFELKTKEMAREIVEANYNQTPIDIKGRLYDRLLTYSSLPAGEHVKRNYTDTADKGTDYLCSMDYIEYNHEVYITDVVFTDAAMEVTEPDVAKMLNTDGVVSAVIESNNGGRGFGRNIKRLLEERYNNYACQIIDKNQTSNKEARILSSSAWVAQHVFMPENWEHRWPELYKQIMDYQKKGRNKHDDAVDVLAGIYEQVTNNGGGVVRMSL